MKNRPFHKRLGFASAGLVAAWRRERSFRTQSIIGLIAIVVTAVLRPGLLWAGLVTLAVALVLAFELINSALEHLIDHIHPTIAPEIKLAKDVAAAAVLVVSIAAVGVGILMIIDWLRH